MTSNSLFPEYVVSGLADPDKVQSDLATQCRDAFNVVIRPSIVAEVINGQTVVAAYIPEAAQHDKPVYIKSKGAQRGAFRRIGATDQRCTEDDIVVFHQDRGSKTFDQTPVVGTSLADVDTRAVQEYRRLRGEINPNAAELRFNNAELLYSLGATADSSMNPQLTVAGLMLFGNAAALRRHFPMTRVDYLRVDGNEWVPDPERRYQAVEIRESLLLMIPRVISLILDDIPKAFHLPTDSIYRQEVPLIPRNVIREAVVNAVMHRNYRTNGSVQIIRYGNRLELKNPGCSRDITKSCVRAS